MDMVNHNELSWTEKEILREKKAEAKHEKRLKREYVKAEARKRELELRAIRNSNSLNDKEKTRVSTTKKLIYFILLNCTIVELYSMWAMYVLSDLSALYSLIGAVITESISFAIYAVKAFNETKEEERLRFERDQFEASLETDIDEVEEEVGNDVIENE